jgi:hypothetical protein
MKLWQATHLTVDLLADCIPDSVTSFTPQCIPLVAIFMPVCHPHQPLDLAGDLFTKSVNEHRAGILHLL